MENNDIVEAPDNLSENDANIVSTDEWISDSTDVVLKKHVKKYPKFNFVMKARLHIWWTSVIEGVQYNADWIVEHLCSTM